MTGKNISRDILKQLIKDTDCNPFYVQQLAYYVWQNTSRKANSDIYTKSIEDLINSNYYLFVNDFEMMTESQINFMRALCDGIDKGFSRAEVICKYNLSSSASVFRVIQGLQNKEIIEKNGTKIEFIDPVFKIWLKELFHKQRKYYPRS